MMLKLHSPIPSTNTRRPNEITKSSGIEEIDVLFNGGWPSARLSHVISDRIDLMIHIVLSSAVS